jgi:hypothetical protein
MTINPGPLVGTESRPIPGAQDYRTPNYFRPTEMDLQGSVRQDEEGRYTGHLLRTSDEEREAGNFGMFNVRTEARAKAVMESASQRRFGQRGQAVRGLQDQMEDRYNKKRGR